MPKRPSQGPIAIFDSGFGGLTILKEIAAKLPGYDYIYLGDTARVPYGTRSAEKVYEFTAQAVDFLFSEGAELIVLACNTASAEALRKIQRSYIPLHHPGKNVLGVIIPAAEEAAERTTNKKIGVIATEGTVRSETFLKELTRLDAELKVFQKACPLLVPLVETEEHRSKAAELILRGYLEPLLKKDIDTLILGCTHYSVLESAVRKIVGKRLAIISEPRIVARKLKEYLLRHPEMDAKLSKGKKRTFYSTDLTDRFRTLGGRFFGAPVSPIKATLD